MKSFLSRQEEEQVVDLLTELLQNPEHWIVTGNVLTLKSQLYSVDASDSSLDKAMMQQYALPPRGLQIRQRLGMAFITHPDMDMRLSAFWRLSKEVKAFYRRRREAEYQRAGKSVLWNLLRAKRRADKPPLPAPQDPTTLGRLKTTFPLVASTSLRDEWSRLSDEWSGTFSEPRRWPVRTSSNSSETNQS